jgi:hypothetical protein
MSNYLNNLVARQLDSESLVQPRLPSFFEPPAFASAFPHSLVAVDSPAAVASIGPIDRVPTIEPLTVEPKETEHRVAMQPEAANPIKPSGSPSSFASSSNETPGTIWRGRQTMESIASLPAELTPEKPDEADRAVRAPQIQVEGVPLEMQETTTTLTPLSSVSRETSPVPWQNNRQLLSRRPLIERPGNANDQTTAARLIQTNMNETMIDETRSGIESKKDRRIVQPRVVLPGNQRAANDSVKHTQPPMSEPSPVINVTIGRIEVRATTPATPSRKQPSAKPLMSLDEYLQRRTRGGGI